MNINIIYGKLIVVSKVINYSYKLCVSVKSFVAKS